MSDTAEEFESPLGEYKGYPIVEMRAEFRGIEGGFNRGTSVQPVVSDPADDVFFAGKARKIGERHDFVVKVKDTWRIVRADDIVPEGVVLVQIYKVLGGGFADEKLVGEAVHAVMEEAAKAEALRKQGQGSFDTGIHVVE